MYIEKVSICSANQKKGRVFVIFLVRSTKKITKTLPFFWLAEILEGSNSLQTKQD